MLSRLSSELRASLAIVQFLPVMASAFWHTQLQCLWENSLSSSRAISTSSEAWRLCLVGVQSRVGDDNGANGVTIDMGQGFMQITKCRIWLHPASSTPNGPIWNCSSSAGAAGPTLGSRRTSTGSAWPRRSISRRFSAMRIYPCRRSRQRGDWDDSKLAASPCHPRGLRGPKFSSLFHSCRRANNTGP